MKNKYLLLLLSLFIIIFSFNSVRAQETGNDFIGKLGTSYASKPGKFGLDLSFNYFYNIDPFFVAGGEFDFFWINWKRTVGPAEFGDLSGDEIATTDAFTFPVFFNVQLRLPNVVKWIYVEPYLTVGLGYCMMVLHNSVPGIDSVTRFYGGFAWQVLASAAYKPSERSRVAFLLDMGFRGMNPSRDNVDFSMSGFLTRIGVKIGF